MASTASSISTEFSQVASTNSGSYTQISVETLVSKIFIWEKTQKGNAEEVMHSLRFFRDKKKELAQILATEYAVQGLAEKGYADEILDMIEGLPTGDQAQCFAAKGCIFSLIRFASDTAEERIIRLLKSFTPEQQKIAMQDTMSNVALRGNRKNEALLDSIDPASANLEREALAEIASKKTLQKLTNNLKLAATELSKDHVVENLSKYLDNAYDILFNIIKKISQDDKFRILSAKGCITGIIERCEEKQSRTTALMVVNNIIDMIRDFTPGQQRVIWQDKATKRTLGARGFTPKDGGTLEVSTKNTVTKVIACRI